jgi:hypothetical protein
MKTISFKLPPALRRRLAVEARRRGVSQSTIIRETLVAALLHEPTGRGELTCADLAGELVGSVGAPLDLATNKRYLEAAIVGSTAEKGVR